MNIEVKNDGYIAGQSYSTARFEPFSGIWDALTKQQVD